MINWDDFIKIDIRSGTILKVEEFEKAHKPAYILTIDFGNEIGVKKSGAQLKESYSKEDLIGKQILAVVNFPPKQIANFMSECLVTAFVTNGKTILAIPEQNVPNGTKLL